MSGVSPFDREPDLPRSSRRSEQGSEGEAILRKLVGMDPGAFLSLVGFSSAGPVTLIEWGVFPHVVPVDMVLRASAKEPWLAVVELVTRRDADVVARLEVTSIHVAIRLNLPIAPVVVLVRPEADDSGITGRKVVRGPGGEAITEFSYEVARIWQEPPAHPPGGRQTSTLERLQDSGLPDLIRTLQGRVAASRSGQESEPVTWLVFALPDAARVDQKVLDEVTELERMAPCVYLMVDKRDDGRIVSREEGCAVMRWKLFQQGIRRFGLPDERIASIIGCITSPRRLTALDHMIARIASNDRPITTWDQLLAWREPDGDPSNCLGS
jgi:hypothetical protein